MKARYVVIMLAAALVANCKREGAPPTRTQDVSFNATDMNADSTIAPDMNADSTIAPDTVVPTQASPSDSDVPVGDATESKKPRARGNR
jgi:hypothetical protein